MGAIGATKVESTQLLPLKRHIRETVSPVVHVEERLLRWRVMFGIFIDVTGRKQAEESRELLAGEMSHRVQNLLTTDTGLTAITSRSTKTTADIARELTQRLTALGRAHDLVRPVPGQAEGAPLALLAVGYHQ